MKKKKFHSEATDNARKPVDYVDTKRTQKQ